MDSEGVVITFVRVAFMILVGALKGRYGGVAVEVWCSGGGVVRVAVVLVGVVVVVVVVVVMAC